MAEFRAVHDLMTAVGPLLDLLGVEEFAEQRLWQLVFDEDLVVFADFDEELGKLTISADVAQIPAGNREKLFEALLQFNYQWEITGGLRLAIDGPEGDVVLACDLSAAELDATSFQLILDNFFRSVRDWRSMIASGAWDDAGGAGLSSLENVSGIRV